MEEFRRVGEGEPWSAFQTLSSNRNGRIQSPQREYSSLGGREENEGCITLIKKKMKLSSYKKEIQMGLVAKSYVMKGFLIYEEMRKYFTIYEEAVSHI